MRRRPQEGITGSMIVALAFSLIAALVVVDKYFGSHVEPSDLGPPKQSIAPPADAATIAAARAQPEADAKAPSKDSAERSRPAVAAAKNKIERTPTGSAPGAKEKGWVYLGLAADEDRWLQSFFEDLPACADGPVEPPVVITSLRGVKVRTRPSTAGSEVNRLKEHARVQLLRMLSFSQETANHTRICWGEIELSAPTESDGD